MYQMRSGMTQVNQQGDNDHDVAQEAGQHGGSEQRLELLSARRCIRAQAMRKAPLLMATPVNKSKLIQNPHG